MQHKNHFFRLFSSKKVIFCQFDSDLFELRGDKGGADRILFQPYVITAKAISSFGQEKTRITKTGGSYHVKAPNDSDLRNVYLAGVWTRHL